jgi:uncharacterized protein YjgD (DUF1641 family)
MEDIPADVPEEPASAIERHPEAAERLLGGPTATPSEDAEAGLAVLAELQRSGALEELLELAEVVSLLTAALDDEMVTTVARTGASLGELGDVAADETTRNGLMALLEAVGEAERADTEAVGLLGLARTAREPEVRAGLAYLLAVARALGEGEGST